MSGIGRGRPRNKNWDEIVSLRKAGERLEIIADKFGLSKQRVQQICKLANVKPPVVLKHRRVIPPFDTPEKLKLKRINELISALSVFREALDNRVAYKNIVTKKHCRMAIRDIERKIKAIDCGVEND